MNVAVFGASGVVGSALLPLLTAEHEVTAVSRSARQDEPCVHWLQGDASFADDVSRAVEEASVVYYLVHSLGSNDFERHDREAAENVAGACERAGVKQIIYLGGLGDDARQPITTPPEPARNRGTAGRSSVPSRPFAPR